MGQHSDYLHQQAEQQKKQVSLQIEQQVNQLEMKLTQQFNAQLLELQQTTAMHKAALEQQALALTLDYRDKKTREDLMMRQHQLQMDHAEAQNKFAEEMQRLQGSVSVPVPPGGPLPPH